MYKPSNDDFKKVNLHIASIHLVNITEYIHRCIDRRKKIIVA